MWALRSSGKTCGDPLVGNGNGAGRRGRPAEAGYTLVIFMMAIAIMSIMMGVAVQAVSFSMQREREAELIFRGEQYVEAIRLFKSKYGRYPMRLKEIWEAKPRVVRKKWKDPMTDSEKWDVIFLGQHGRQRGLGLPGERGDQAREDDRQRFDEEREKEAASRAERGGEREDDSPFGGFDPTREGEKVGPIIGVRTTECEDSIKVWEGRTNYCDWEFVFREEQEQGRGVVIPGGGVPGGGVPGGGPGDRPGDGPGPRPPRPRVTGTPDYEPTATPTPTPVDDIPPDDLPPDDLPRTTPTPYR